MFQKGLIRISILFKSFHCSSHEYGLQLLIIGYFLLQRQEFHLILNSFAKTIQKMFSYFQVIIWYYLSRYLSKVLGYLSHIPIPRFLRAPIIGYYARRTSSRLYEASSTSLESYRTIHEFFIREIRPRPISHVDMVAPVDGTVLSVGKLVDIDWKVRQIKNITYPVDHILGMTAFELEDLRKLGDSLHFVSIHLPVSECHRFRSPVDWEIKERLHIPGTMYDLDATSIYNYPSVFYNERVVLSGNWKHGKFWFVAFGSYKVGSIRLKFDPSLRTNYLGESIRKEEKDETFKALEFGGLKTTARLKTFENSIHLKKGAEFGNFEAGSAFVMIFQYEGVNFVVQPPQFMTYGSPLVS